MCIVCKRDAKRKIINGYFRCTFCDSIIVHVLPKDSEVQNILEEHADKYILKNGEQLSYDDWKKRLNLIKRYNRNLHNILDFGCGFGNFVKYVLSEGYNITGYDKSELIKRHLLRTNVPFYKKISDIPMRHFDVVTCFDVIEHTTDPEFFIQKIKERIKIGGLLFITTPNSRGVSAKILKSKWWVFGPEAHYILFSVKSLSQLLNRLNFKILYTSTDIITPWFTPTNNFIFKILNKLVYNIIFPFRKLLFDNNMGDNINILAKFSSE